jgi:hypothetical protein
MHSKHARGLNFYFFFLYSNALSYRFLRFFFSLAGISSPFNRDTELPQYYPKEDAKTGLSRERLCRMALECDAWQVCEKKDKTGMSRGRRGGRLERE